MTFVAVQALTGRVVFCTGHRPDKLGGYATSYLGHSPKRANTLRYIYETLQRNRPTLLIVGMAQGWDQWVAAAASDAGIPFEAFVPFVNQPKPSPLGAQLDYRKLLGKAAKVVQCWIGAPATFSLPQLYQRRNEQMVDAGEVGWACWDGSPGGTANCINYAVVCGKPIVRYTP